MTGKEFRKIRETLGLTLEEMGGKIGVTGTQIHRLEKKESEEITKPISKLASNMLLESSQSLSPQTTKPKKTITYYPDIYASAGYGAINQEDTECVVYDGSFLDVIGITRQVELIQVRGDSMLPYVSNGDFVIIERTCEAKNGDIVIINYCGDLFIKQLQKNPQKQTLSFISSNKEYPSFELKSDEVISLTIIGILKAVIRPF